MDIFTDSGGHSVPRNAHVESHLATGHLEQTDCRYRYSGTDISLVVLTSDRQNKEHIRENRTKNRTNNRQNRILQKNPNILLFIRLELYRITRPNSFVFILQNNQTEMALLGQTVLPPEPFPFFENTRFLVLCSRGLSKWACCFPHDGQNL